MNDNSLDLSGPAPSGPAQTGPAPTHQPTPATNPLDLSTPATNPLDLSTPATNPLDLSTPATNSLDLSTPSSPAPPATNPVVAQPPSIHPVRRLDGDDREILAPERPTLALTRVQSGVGRLAIELFAPPTPALALACIVTDADGESSVIDPTHPHSSPPPLTTDPLITFSGNGFGSFGINLRRSRELSRLIVVATATIGQPVDWTGTLSVTTFVGGRIDIPLDATPPSTTAIVASIYNVDGEYVLRAEGQPMNGSLREAARSFGFDTISWLDARTPIG